MLVFVLFHYSISFHNISSKNHDLCAGLSPVKMWWIVGQKINLVAFFQSSVRGVHVVCVCVCVEETYHSCVTKLKCTLGEARMQACHERRLL